MPCYPALLTRYSTAPHRTVPRHRDNHAIRPLRCLHQHPSRTNLSHRVRHATTTSVAHAPYSNGPRAPDAPTEPSFVLSAAAEANTFRPVETEHLPIATPALALACWFTATIAKAAACWPAISEIPAFPETPTVLAAPARRRACFAVRCAI